MEESFSGAINLDKGKPLKPETGGSSHGPGDKVDLLSNIIDKINLMYKGQFTEADRVIVETIFDKLTQQPNSTLKKKANNSDVQMFVENIFPKEFDKIAQSCYMEQTDAFVKLFEDGQLYQRVMAEMGKAIYQKYRNGQSTE